MNKRGLQACEDVLRRLFHYKMTDNDDSNFLREVLK